MLVCWTLHLSPGTLWILDPVFSFPFLSWDSRLQLPSYISENSIHLSFPFLSSPFLSFFLPFCSLFLFSFFHSPCCCHHSYNYKIWKNGHNENGNHYKFKNFYSLSIFENLVELSPSCDTSFILSRKSAWIYSFVVMSLQGRGRSGDCWLRTEVSHLSSPVLVWGTAFCPWRPDWPASFLIISSLTLQNTSSFSSQSHKPAFPIFLILNGCHQHPASCLSQIFVYLPQGSSSPLIYNHQFFFYSILFYMLSSQPI